jgi:hypothetical protein
MIVAAVNTLSPDTSTAGYTVITPELRLSAWLTGLQLAIPTVLAMKDLASLFQLYHLPSSVHLGSGGLCAPHDYIRGR